MNFENLPLLEYLSLDKLSQDVDLEELVSHILAERPPGFYLSVPETVEPHAYHFI